MITIEEFKSYVKPCGEKSIVDGRWYDLGDFWTCSYAALWARPKPTGCPVQECCTLESLRKALIAYVTDATEPLELAGVRVADKGSRRWESWQAVLFTPKGERVLLNAQFLAFALKGHRGAVRFLADPCYNMTPVVIWGDDKDKPLAVIMPMVECGGDWETVCGEVTR